jgi:hypothetical protein
MGGIRCSVDAANAVTELEAWIWTPAFTRIANLAAWAGIVAVVAMRGVGAGIDAADAGTAMRLTRLTRNDTRPVDANPPVECAVRERQSRAAILIVDEAVEALAAIENPRMGAGARAIETDLVPCALVQAIAAVERIEQVIDANRFGSAQATDATERPRPVVRKREPRFEAGLTGAVGPSLLPDEFCRHDAAVEIRYSVQEKRGGDRRIPMDAGGGDDEFLSFRCSETDGGDADLTGALLALVNPAGTDIRIRQSIDLNDEIGVDADLVRDRGRVEG